MSGQGIFRKACGIGLMVEMDTVGFVICQTRIWRIKKYQKRIKIL